MELNLAALRSQTRFKTGISNTTTLSNTEIDIQLNEAYSKLVRAVVDVDQDYFEEQKASFNLVANSSLYSLPSDYIKIKQVRLAYSTPSSQGDYYIATSYDPSQGSNVSIDEVNVPVSNPQVDITNNYCRIYPKPSSSVTAGGQYYYIARPSALTLTGDTMIIPADYHDLAPEYAAAKIMEKFENFSRSDRCMNNFEKGIENMKREISGREMNRELRFRSYGESTRSNRKELPN